MWKRYSKLFLPILGHKIKIENSLNKVKFVLLPIHIERKIKKTFRV